MEDQSGKAKATRKILQVARHPDSNTKTKSAFKSVGTSVNCQNRRRTKEEFSIKIEKKSGYGVRQKVSRYPARVVLPFKMDPDKEHSACRAPGKHTKRGSKDPAYRLNT